MQVLLQKLYLLFELCALAPRLLDLLLRTRNVLLALLTQHLRLLHRVELRKYRVIVRLLHRLLELNLRFLLRLLHGGLHHFWHVHRLLRCHRLLLRRRRDDCHRLRDRGSNLLLALTRGHRDDALRVGALARRHLGRARLALVAGHLDGERRAGRGVLREHRRRLDHTLMFERLTLLLGEELGRQDRIFCEMACRLFAHLQRHVGLLGRVARGSRRR